MSLHIPSDEISDIKKTIYPLISWIDQKFEIIKICDESLKTKVDNDDGRLWYHAPSNRLTTPAIAIMIFRSDSGPRNCNQLSENVLEAPWVLHHSVQLQKKTSPGLTVGQQNFYQISPELPLWSVCPCVAGQEHLRINVFVVNFRKMVEFYRLLTDVEMESSKAGFCFFQLRSSRGESVKLALKQCPSLNPQPLAQACLHFKIRNLENLKCLIKAKIWEISASVYCVLDPDGNRVHLTDIDQSGGDDEAQARGVGSDSVCSTTFGPIRVESHDLVPHCLDSNEFVPQCMHSRDIRQRHVNSLDKVQSPEQSPVNPKVLYKCGNIYGNTESLDSGLVSDLDRAHSQNQNYSILFPWFSDTSEESEFMDPWEGSQYNQSVNPSREYRFLSRLIQEEPDEFPGPGEYFQILSDECYPNQFENDTKNTIATKKRRRYFKFPRKLMNIF
ncbi:hypothetical protein SNE40_003429 [Patella caerulea]|uniref:FAM124 domain-containing protein n=1 Tax=Patella caerulea TaxID=87958 RepID=A0AAN8Q085_PATCE